MRVRCCGVRGSTPAPGDEFVHVGGHTSCVAVWADGGHVPSLLLDAGTGIRSVTALLGGAAFDGTILLTHLHWDHVQGLPFFAAGDRDDARVRLLLPVDDGVDPGAQPRGTDRDAVALASLRRSMSPPSFPIGPEGLRGAWTIGAAVEGTVEQLEGFDVLAHHVPHKGGRTLGYRISDEKASIAYLPDHLPGPRGSDDRARVLALADRVDLLIHDGQFTEEEAATADAYGHSTIEQAIDLAVEAGVGTLVLTHHSPARTDDEVDDLERRHAGCGVPVLMARDGLDLVG